MNKHIVMGLCVGALTVTSWGKVGYYSKPKMIEEADLVAERLVSNRKFHQSLQERYGGAVIWQQAGIEAVGAMRLWLEEHEKQGHFAIDDEDLREAFWEYYLPPYAFEIEEPDPFKTSRLTPASE